MPAPHGTGTLRRMSSPASLESFERELNRLVAKFEKEFTAVTDPGYSEARLRQDYLDPFIRALGWTSLSSPSYSSTEKRSRVL